MSLSKHFLSLFARNRNTIIVFAVGVILCTALSFVSLSLCALALSALSVVLIVLYIKLMITEHKAYYHLLKNRSVPAPSRLFINSVICVSIALIVTLALFFGCMGLTVRAALATDLNELTFEAREPLTEEQEKLLSETAEALEVFAEETVKRGYTSPAPYLALFIVSMVSTFVSVIKLHTAVTFAPKFKIHPFVTVLIALFVIGFVNDFIISLLTTLVMAAAPGIGNAINEINSFLSVSGTEEYSAEFIYDMAKNLPYAATLVKVTVISAICSIIAAFTNALVSITVLNKEK